MLHLELVLPKVSLPSYKAYCTYFEAYEQTHAQGGLMYTHQWRP